MRKGAHSTTIIKRSGRKGHHGVHTGAWKVAFADFTLAMMALFMVLWIVGAVDENERKEIVAQLNGTSIFDGTPFTPISLPGSKGPAVMGDSAMPERQSSQQALPQQDTASQPAHKDLPAPPAESLDQVLARSDLELDQLSEAIMKITSTLKAQGNLSLEKVPQGLRILLQDNDDRQMFARGSAAMTPYFTRLLTELSPVFNRLDNQVMITGHTDSANYHNNATYNNWNLSGDRALAARRVLERGGLEPQRVLQVNAMADNMLLDPDQPLSARNRRIEILVLTKAAANTLYQFYGHHGVNVVKPAADRIR
ncbi:putative lateral flagellar export/assembly protein LafU [Pantoea sp. BAV 3049]|uniref:putative lateral flagellar export/assembly protein LafU n=1 Tax=Pantoea sp. BAV 3049 TaxID=2654188 RepID=UPI00131C07BB|nr:putative lateral flagellar export/assembly protein LafU [Pantoea sp. BAV 3049]